MRKQRQPSVSEIFGLTPRRRRRGLRWTSTPLLVLSGAALVGAVFGVAPALLRSDAAAAGAYAEPLTGCTVTDGDTIRCGDERIRLLAIDAPEMPGHCRRGRICAPGDPYASTQSLGDALADPLTIERVSRDRYGRTLARVAGVRGDLSCWQLRHGQAIYKSAWDDGSRIARLCQDAIR